MSVPIKRILVVAYSQTGQLTEITQAILAPLREDPACEIHIEQLRPKQPFPFPWSFWTFLDAFPESALLRPSPLAPLTLSGDEDFDLVILPYQVWFLAPSQPVTAFLQHPVAQRLLRGKPVVTVIGCRNMWMLAQEKMKSMLHNVGARLLDNVALVDPSPTMVTLLTTPLWLLTGKKQPIRSLPPAGVDDSAIRAARRFGSALRDALATGRERTEGPLLDGLQAAVVDPHLMVSERAATRSFAIWGRLVCAAGEPGEMRRKPVLMLYVIFLITLILTVVPLSLCVQSLLRPLMRRRFAAIKARFEQPSGCGNERMKDYGC